MSNYSQFFLNSWASVVQYELLDISHPNFSQTYRLVRNNANGVTVDLEDHTTHFYTYYPMRITSPTVKDDLDSSFQIEFGDLGEVLPAEIDAVFSANGFGIKPTVLYRTYRSDQLSSPLFGPISLVVNSISFNESGATIQAQAPALNMNKTGELYKIDRFPMLRGFL